MGSGFCGFFTLFPVDASVFAGIIDDPITMGINPHRKMMRIKTISVISRVVIFATF